MSISFDSLRGGMYYFYYIGKDGKRKRKSLRTKIYDEACNEAIQVQKELGLISEDTFKEKYEPDELTLLKLSNLVLPYAKNNFTYGTYELYVSTLKYLISYFGHQKIVSSIKLEELEALKFEKLKCVRPTTVNGYIRKIKACFNVAIKFGLLEKNPAKHWAKLREVEKQRKIFNDIEYKKLLSVISDESFKYLVLFGYYTGCRVGELVNLQWNDINLKEKFIEIRNKEKFTTKTGKNRKIPISKKLLTIINEMKKAKGEDFVFMQKHGKKFTKDRATRFMKRYLKKANLPEYLTFHCLRHTFITTLLRKGISIYIVKSLAGHSDIKTTEIYSHLVTDDLREAVNCF